ncbi:MAG: terminase large subunit domain-containing protein [Capsulimonadaceae bacterium]
MIFRRERPQITNEGGLWDTSCVIFPGMGGTPGRASLTWRWANGVKGSFAQLQHEDDKLKWQGSQIPYLGFDELTHFTESQFFYLLSRNRSPSGIRPKVRATCNPGPGWVKGFLAPWLDVRHPQHAESGDLRWFTRIHGQIVWVDAGWRDSDGHPPKSVTFIRAQVRDNPILLDVNPEYLVNLKSLPLVERSRLLDGNWDIFEGAYFSEWSEAAHTCLPRHVPAWYRFFGGLDYGQAAPFCFLLLACDDGGNVLVVDEVYRTRLHPSEQADLVAEVLERYDIHFPSCLIWADPSIFPPRTPEQRRGHPGKYIVEDYWSAGLNVIAADNDRLNGWARVREFLHEAGRLAVFKGRCPNLTRTIGTIGHDKHDAEDLDTDGEDHAVDALRYALMSRPRKSTPPGPSGPRPDYRPWWMKEVPYYA